MSDLNLDLWQERYREYLTLRQYAAQTALSYGAELRHFFPYLTSHGVDSVAGITPALVEGYRTVLFYAEYRGRRLSFTTQGLRLSAVKGFTRFLWREHYLLIDPGASVERPRVDRTLPRTLLSEAEVAQLLLAPDVTDVLGLRDRAMLEVFYSTGIRNTELCLLATDAVCLAEGELSVRRGKGGKGRRVPLGEEAVRWLRAYLQDSRPHLATQAQGKERTLFLTVRGRPFQHRTLTVLVIHLGERAGLPMRVTPHLLRHACATHMLARGAGLRHLQELLGHATPATTQRYTRVVISDLKSVHRRFHPREQAPSSGETP